MRCDATSGFRTVRRLMLLAAALLSAGCNSNPFTGQGGGAGASTAWQQPGAQQPYETQIADLNRRTGQLDANNRDLHAQLAQSQQQVQVMRDQVTLLQRRLEDTVTQLRDTQTARQEAERQVNTLQASLQRRGNAVITANSSIRAQLGIVEIPGVDVKQDQDVIRIELLSDQLFVGNSVQFQPNAYMLLDQVAMAIQRTYPRQRIGIEGHTELPPNPGLPNSATHQLTTAQTAAVLDQFVQRNRLPAQQLFTVSHGSNHPKVTTAATDGRVHNRRIEIVVYPDTF